MGVVNDILSQVDAGVESVASTGFAQIAGAMGNVVAISSTVLIGLLGVNVLMQMHPMSWSSFFAFAIKLSLVTIFALSWDNFEIIYQIATQVPESIGSAILGLTGTGTNEGLYSALDDMVNRVTAYGDSIGDNAGWVFGAVLGVAFFVIAAIFAAIAAGIIAYARIVLTLMIVFGPIAMTCALFKPTLPIFESWTKSLMGYAFMPIAAAGAAGIIVAIATNILGSGPNPDTVSTLSTIFPFMAILLLSAGVMAAVPSIASGMSGAFMLASNAAGLTNLAKQGIVKSGSVAGKVATSPIASVKSAAGSVASTVKTKMEAPGAMLSKLKNMRGK